MPEVTLGGDVSGSAASDDMSRRLREAPERSGLSLRQLAKHLHISASALSQIETGKSRPSARTLYALVSELGISLDELFENTGHENGPGERPLGFPVRARSSAVTRRCSARLRGQASSSTRESGGSASPRRQAQHVAQPVHPLRRSRHLSPRVPESTGIRGYPRPYAAEPGEVGRRKGPANRTLFAHRCRAELVDRTQEVGGSSPPSSIGSKPLQPRGFRCFRGSRQSPACVRPSSSSVRQSGASGTAVRR
jgi:transcriptional regulator with XRE-family HTH domain